MLFNFNVTSYLYFLSVVYFQYTRLMKLFLKILVDHITFAIAVMLFKRWLILVLVIAVCNNTLPLYASNEHLNFINTHHAKHSKFYLESLHVSLDYCTQIYTMTVENNYSHSAWNEVSVFKTTLIFYFVHLFRLYLRVEFRGSLYMI